MQYDPSSAAMQLKYLDSITQSTIHISGTTDHVSILMFLCLDSWCLLLRTAQDYEPADVSDSRAGECDETLQDNSFSFLIF